jgi:tetratricopeptide (TPR) repeat protein
MGAKEIFPMRQIRSLFLGIGAAYVSCALILGGPRYEKQETNFTQHYELGLKAMREGNLDVAERELRLVVVNQPSDVGARVNLGVVYMRRFEWKQALIQLEVAERLAPQVAGIRLNVGLAYYRQGLYDKAVPPFESVVRDEPGSVQAHRLLGLCYLFVARYKESAEILKAVWSESLSDPSYLYALAVAADQAKNQALAEKALTGLLAMSTSESGDRRAAPLIDLLIGKAYMQRDDYVQAMIELQKALALDPRLPMLHYHLGLVYRHDALLPEARAEFLADLAIEPQVADAVDQLGEVEYSLGDIPSSRKHLEQAVRLNPRLGTAWFYLAKIYLKNAQYDAALTALGNAAAVDDKSTNVHYLRAQTLKQMGRPKEAAAEFATVKRLEQQTTSRLEKELNGGYRDPQLQVEPQPHSPPQ